MSERGALSAGTALATIAALTWRRLLRGRAVWVSVVIAVLPVLYALVVRGQAGRMQGAAGEELWVFELLIAALLAPMFVASSIGEEIEDRTSTYLWSRPIPRWSIIAGKLLAFVPVVAAIITACWAVAYHISWDQFPPARAMGALALGGAMMCVVSAAIATLAPRFGMALSICYLLFFDSPLGIMPATLRELSLTHQARALSGDFPAEAAITQPLIALAIMLAVWTAIIAARIRRLEA